MKAENTTLANAMAFALGVPIENLSSELSRMYGVPDNGLEDASFVAADNYLNEEVKCGESHTIPRG